MVAMIKKYTVEEMRAYGSAGSVAQEALSSIRNVFAFCVQRATIATYSTRLVEAELMSKKKGLVVGMFAGASNALFNGCFAIAIVYGSYLVRTDCKSYSPSNIIQSIFCIVATNVAFSQALPFLKDLAEAKGAARKMFDLIDQAAVVGNGHNQTAATSKDSKRKRLEKLNGNIRFNNVRFEYPSRPNCYILNRLDLTIHANMTIALVGPRFDF